ncbi:MAG TPA: hypothetical protein VNH18_03545, partial [Bryobacteraceae bacterium]|nr:hypothetical protein [Bryobacteraceae bacterium]
WKEHEWRNEQRQLAQQRALEKKYSLVDELFRSVAEATTAAEDVVATQTWTWSRADVERRQQIWLTSSTNWRVSSKIIRQKIGTYFATPVILPQFDEIIDKRKQLGNIVTNLITNATPPKEIPAATFQAQGIIASMINNLQACGTAMSEDISRGNKQ